MQTLEACSLSCGVNSRLEMPSSAIVTAVFDGKYELDIYQYLPIVTITVARLRVCTAEWA